MTGEAAAGDGLAVLIVEDDDATAELEKRVLRRAGMSVRRVCSASEAVAALGSEHFHLVLCDYNLPDGDPWPAVQAARADRVRAPVILVTAAGSEAIATEALQHGVTDYLRKGEGFWERLPEVAVRVARLAQAEERRRATEEARLRSEHTLSLAIDGAPIGMAIVGLDGAFLRVNRALCEIVGYAAAELTGLTFQAITHPDDLGADLALAGQLRRGEIPNYQLAKRYLRKDGRVVDVMLSASILRTEDGTPLHYVTQIEDITERRRAETALRASEARFRGLIEHASDGIVIIDPETGQREVNTAACEMLGYTRDELLQANLVDLVAPEEAPRLSAGRELLRAAGGVRLAQWTARRKDGTMLPVEVSAKILPDGRLQAFVRDIRERKALARSEENFRALVEATPIGVCVSRDGRIVYVNGAMVAIFGWERADQMVGRDILEFAHPSAHALIEQRRAGIEIGQKVPPSVVRCVHKDGRELRVEISSVMIAFGDENTALALLRDVTSEQRAEEARASAEAAVRAALAEKEVLLQEIHHRVKNNLQVIASLVNLQAGKLANPAMRTALEEIRSRVRAIALLHEKLYQSKDLAHIDMREYIESLVADVLRTYGAIAKGVSVRTRAEPLRLALDKAMPCGLILSELLTNALKHAFPQVGGDPPRIDVSLRECGGDAELSVADNGVGLPSGADLERADSLGWMLVRTLTRQIRGTLRLSKERGVECAIAFPTS